MALPTALPGRRSFAYPNTDVPFWESEDRGTVPCPWLELSDRKHGYGCSGHDSRGKTRHGKIKRLMSEVLLCGGRSAVAVTTSMRDGTFLRALRNGSVRGETRYTSQFM